MVLSRLCPRLLSHQHPESRSAYDLEYNGGRTWRKASMLCMLNKIFSDSFHLHLKFLIIIIIIITIIVSGRKGTSSLLWLKMNRVQMRKYNDSIIIVHSALCVSSTCFSICHSTLFPFNCARGQPRARGRSLLNLKRFVHFSWSRSRESRTIASSSRSSGVASS